MILRKYFPTRFNTTSQLRKNLLNLNLSDSNRRNLEKAVRLAGYAALGSAGSALAWIAVSSLVINHRRRLEPAIKTAQQRRFTTGAGEVSYYADAGGLGRPLALIHSINAAASAMEMKPLFDRYRGKRPVYAIDLPGFGLSSRADQRYSPELFKRAILDWIEEIANSEAVDVIALSLASEFAALAVIEAPHRFRSLTLISPTGFGDQTLTPSELRRKSLSVPLWSQAFYDLLTSRASLHYFLQKTFEGPVPDELIEYSYETSHQPGARFAPLYFLSGELFTPGVRRSIYESVPVPVLVLHNRDGYVSFRELDPFLRNHMNWAAARIPGTAGMPHWERPEKTIAELDHFWSDIVSIIGSAACGAPTNTVKSGE